jgi:hypothetical protein
MPQRLEDTTDFLTNLARGEVDFGRLPVFRCSGAKFLVPNLLEI